ncbi:MAG: hypothetical protein HFE47_02605 [Clostridia bacterium]|nr:hypothetical protein [Clostridia bacterium]
MTAAEIMILIAVCVAFAGAVAAILYRKITHKGGCCDCSACDGGCGQKRVSEKETKPVAAACDGQCEHCAACRSHQEK